MRMCAYSIELRSIAPLICSQQKRECGRIHNLLDCTQYWCEPYRLLKRVIFFCFSFFIEAKVAVVRVKDRVQALEQVYRRLTTCSRFSSSTKHIPPRFWSGSWRASGNGFVARLKCGLSWGDSWLRGPWVRARGTLWTCIPSRTLHPDSCWSIWTAWPSMTYPRHLSRQAHLLPHQLSQQQQQQARSSSN